MAILQLRKKHGNTLENQLIFKHPTQKNLMIFVFCFLQSRIHNNY